MSFILADFPRYGISHSAHAVFNDLDFHVVVLPSRGMGSIQLMPSNDPLAPWLGEGRHLRLQPSQVGSGGGDHRAPTWQSSGGGASPGTEHVGLFNSGGGMGPEGARRREPVDIASQGGPAVGDPSRPPADNPVAPGQTVHRRSARGWKPSVAALEEIANRVACAAEQVNDLFDGESDDVLMPGLAHTEFDMAYATHRMGQVYPGRMSRYCLFHWRKEIDGFKHAIRSRIVI